MHFVDAKGILTGNSGYYGMNIYRGCSHGCIYCDSRSRCYQINHIFEDIEVKENALVLLEKALKDYTEPIPGAKERVKTVLRIMLTAWAASQLRSLSEEMTKALDEA